MEFFKLYATKYNASIRRDKALSKVITAQFQQKSISEYDDA